MGRRIVLRPLRGSGILRGTGNIFSFSPFVYATVSRLTRARVLRSATEVVFYFSNIAHLPRIGLRLFRIGVVNIPPR